MQHKIPIVETLEDRCISFTSYD